MIPRKPAAPRHVPLPRAVHGAPAQDADRAIDYLYRGMEALSRLGSFHGELHSPRLLAILTPLTLAAVCARRVATCPLLAPDVAHTFLDRSEVVQAACGHLAARNGGDGERLASSLALPHAALLLARPSVLDELAYVPAERVDVVDYAGVVHHEQDAPAAWVLARAELLREPWNIGGFPTHGPQRFCFNPRVERWFEDDDRHELLPWNGRLLVKPPWVRSYQEPISAFANGSDRSVELVHEPDNPYDRYAVSVTGWYRTLIDPPGEFRQAHIGYLPRNLAYEVHAIRDAGRCVEADWVLARYRTGGIAASWRIVLAVDRSARPRALRPRHFEADRPDRASAPRRSAPVPAGARRRSYVEQVAGRTTPGRQSRL